MFSKFQRYLLILTIIVAFYIAFRDYRKGCTLTTPVSIISQQDFTAQAKTGDLLLTQSTNNIMTTLQTLTLKTHVAHVSILVKGEDGVMYMFEGSAPRGAQLRSLAGYVHEGVNVLWWRPLQVDDSVRQQLLSTMEEMSGTPYNWNFMKDIPSLLLDSKHVSSGDIGMACGDLTSAVYEKVGLLQPSRHHKLPMHFYDDTKLTWKKNCMSTAIWSVALRTPFEE